MFDFYHVVSIIILMSAFTDSDARSFIEVLFALFTAVTLPVRQFAALVYRNVIVPIFGLVGADARLCARCSIEGVLAIFMEVTIF